MNAGLLVLRVVVGLLFVGHGTQKLFGWFGGHGPEGTGYFFERQLGYRPGRRHAVLAGLAEAGGGLLLVTGFLVPLGAAAIIGVMVNAIGSVHGPNGLWAQENGFEYPLVNIAVATALAFTGPGAFSVDHAIHQAVGWWHFWGVGWVLAALLVGLVTAVVVLSAREPAAPATEQPATREHRPGRAA